MMNATLGERCVLSVTSGRKDGLPFDGVASEGLNVWNRRPVRCAAWPSATKNTVM